MTLTENTKQELIDLIPTHSLEEIPVAIIEKALLDSLYVSGSNDTDKTTELILAYTDYMKQIIEI